MRVLQKEDIRKEFLELTRSQNLSADGAIDKLFEQISSDDHLLMGFNGVYVYMGTYKLVHECPGSWYPVHEVFVSEEDPTAEYKLFYELDSGLPKCVNIKDDLDYFERNSIIVYIPNARNHESKYTFEQDFTKLRKIYLRELCVNNEETAVALITSDDYIKEVFSVANYMKENNISPVFYQAFYDVALCNTKNNSNAVVLKKTRKQNK